MGKKWKEKEEWEKGTMVRERGQGQKGTLKKGKGRMGSKCL